MKGNCHFRSSDRTGGAASYTFQLQTGHLPEMLQILFGGSGRYTTIGSMICSRSFVSSNLRFAILTKCHD